MPTIKGDSVEFSLRVTRRRMAVLFAAVVAVFSALECGSEEYSLSAFYPVPYGGFQRLNIYKEMYVMVNTGTMSSEAKSVSLTWPDNTAVKFYVNSLGTTFSYNRGFAFYADGAPFRIEVRNSGSSSITLNPVNADSIDNKIMLLASSGQAAYLEKFCYWHTATASTCLTHSPTIPISQWSVMSVTPTNAVGKCDGSTLINTNALPSTYCVLCCKMGL